MQQSGLKTHRVLSYSVKKLMLVHMYVCVISEHGMLSHIDMLMQMRTVSLEFVMLIIQSRAHILIKTRESDCGLQCLLLSFNNHRYVDLV